MKLLILDNYDSFTYNLAHLVEKVSDFSFDVIQNDKLDLETVKSYDMVLLSPGPGLPSEAGCMMDLIKRYYKNKPILGVCLGHQAIGEMFGATLKNLDTVFHGLAAPVQVVAKNTLFRNCPNTFLAGRYHSWVIAKENLPDELIITAVDHKNEIMAITHRDYPIHGIQFHPESILSEHGETILRNWLQFEN